MAEIHEDRSLSDKTLFMFSNQDVDTSTFIPSSLAASKIPKVTIPSPPTSPTTYLLDPASTDDQVSPNSFSTIEAYDNDPAVDFPSTAGVQSLASNNF